MSTHVEKGAAAPFFVSSQGLGTKQAVTIAALQQIACGAGVKASFSTAESAHSAGVGDG